MAVSKLKCSVYLTGEGWGEKQRFLRIGVRLNNRLHRCYLLKLSDIHGVHQLVLVRGQDPQDILQSSLCWYFQAFWITRTRDGLKIEGRSIRLSDYSWLFKAFVQSCMGNVLKGLLYKKKSFRAKQLCRTVLALR